MSASLDQLLEQQVILPMFSATDEELAIQWATQLYDAGCRVFEFLNRQPHALDIFKVLKAWQQLQVQEVRLLAGTILNQQQAVQFLNAGADGLVSPGWVSGIAELRKSDPCWWMPGAVTPSEWQQAYDAGCSWLKFFPASVWGVDLLGQMRAVFPTIRVCATGGLAPSIETWLSWRKAGAQAFGVGHALIEQLSLPLPSGNSPTSLKVLFNTLRVHANPCICH